MRVGLQATPTVLEHSRGGCHRWAETVGVATSSKFAQTRKRRRRSPLFDTRSTPVSGLYHFVSLHLSCRSVLVWVSLNLLSVVCRSGRFFCFCSAACQGRSDSSARPTRNARVVCDA